MIASLPLLFAILAAALPATKPATKPIAKTAAKTASASHLDSRNIQTGHKIPTLSYSDQPYIVKTDDGAWLCAVTTGTGPEGKPGQLVETMRSTDEGRTWSKPLAVEPPGGPEASYAVMLKVASGRIYIFYNHNTDNIRSVPAETKPGAPAGTIKRVDSLGYFVFKFTDDGGKSSSAKRYPIPVREMDIDRCNPFGGKIRFFWNVGKPFLLNGAAFVSLHKVGGFGEGFFTRTEGVLLKSSNLATERDPEKITWETLPDGEFGLRTPPGGGPIAEEQSYSTLSDGSIFCVYRTIDGHPACAYSRDGGHHWTTPEYQRFADGHLMKHPRAANFAWKCANGKYLYWFHNHGGRFILEDPKRRTMAYDDRNPAWVCGGVEVDTPQGREIKWSQPEILLYDVDPWIRMSYPDLVEDGGKYFITETQKDVARVHEINPALLAGLWGQFDAHHTKAKGAIVDLSAAKNPLPATVELPKLPDFVDRDSSRADYGKKDLRAGFSLDLRVQFDSLAADQVLVDNRTESGQGFCLRTTPRGTVEIVLDDGRSESRWECDPTLLDTKKPHHILAIVDGGPKIIMFVVDGRLCDGGDFRQFGWGRFNPNFRGPTGDATLRIGPSLKGKVESLAIYNRALRVSEAVASYQAGAIH